VTPAAPRCQNPSIPGPLPPSRQDSLYGRTSASRMTDSFTRRAGSWPSETREVSRGWAGS
jgi:hypothetical protein